MSKWTNEQLLAINSEGKNIIVSAGAGSGKTAVLSERVLRKINDNVPINKLLILTFTNEAAKEMKDRIRKKLINEKKSDQLNLLEESYITTFDSYSLSIVKKYHYLLNVSKDIKIIDDTIISNLKDKFIDEIFEELYKNEDENFLKLINDFCLKDDRNIKEMILNISKKIDLKIDKELYLRNYINEFYNDENVEKLYLEYKKLIDKKLSNISYLLDLFSNYSDSDYYEKVYNLVYPLINSKTYEEYNLYKNITLPRTTKLDEDAKKVKEELNKEIKSLVSIIIYDDEKSAKESIYLTKPYVDIIIKIISLLDEKLNNYKFSKDVYEFTDISKMAIKVVKDNDDVRQELKEFYNEIMIDEYQDTNDLQEEFISLIENNNVYMVGDIKQSIYRFRNANPLIFKNKYDLYSNNISGMKIDLLKNFRSRSEVLNNINLLFDYVMDDFLGGADYIRSHRMVFGNTSYNEEGKTANDYNLELYNYNELKDYSKEEIEAFIIANDIKNKIENNYQVFDKDSKVLKNISYSDICIIMDRGTAFETYKKIFESMGIPLSIYADFKLNNEYDIITLENILRIIIKIKNKEYDKEFIYLYTSIERSFVCDSLDEEIFKNIKDNNIYKTTTYEKAKTIAETLDLSSPSKVLNEIINTFNIYEKILTLTDIDKILIRIDNLINMACTLESIGYNVYDFSEYLKEVRNKKAEIKYSEAKNTSNSVKIMNIHKSKGLEFNICYFSGLYKEFNISDIKDKFLFSSYGITTPYYKDEEKETFIKFLIKEKYMEEEISEKIRLFYVALTRCKEKMIMVCPLEDKENTLIDKVLDNNIRLKYKSFKDILESIKYNLNSYIKYINLDDIYISKEYKLNKQKTYENYINKNNEKINVKENNIENVITEKKHASKTINKIITKEEFNNMKYGTKMHYILETTSFNETSEKIVNNLLKSLNVDGAKIYKEHEFVYEKEDVIYHGIIDLILEYKDHIKIIDYKLKNINDKEYLKQLNVYKDYILSKKNIPVKTYLYSIIDEKLYEINI